MLVMILCYARTVTRIGLSEMPCRRGSTRCRGEFVFAILGVALLALFVRSAPRDEREDPEPKVTLAGAAHLVGRGSFARLVVAASLVALFTISDGFVYLALQQRVEFDTAFFPLLYVATALVYMLLVVPVGVPGDRIGRVRVFLGGCIAFLAVYGVPFTALDGLGMVGLVFALLGPHGTPKPTGFWWEHSVSVRLGGGDLEQRGTRRSPPSEASLRSAGNRFAFGALWTATDVHMVRLPSTLLVSQPGFPLWPYLCCEMTGGSSCVVG